MFDPAVFDPAAVSAETHAQNRDILTRLAALPDPAAVPPALIRERRAQGLGPFPPMPRSKRAETIMIDGPGGPLSLRIIAPAEPTGIYLHIHGGGWTWGTADEQDPWLERLADRCGLAVVSVEYRLAPEHPAPAPQDDCEAAARWVVDEGRRRFGTDRLFIGGESAGAHLSVVTLLRLRDRHRLTPFRGANLFAGCYDLSLTPSAARWGSDRLVLNTADIRMFADNLCGPSRDRRDPDLSPLHADLAGMPPALLSVGTQDPLLDDTLFMTGRWSAAGNRVDTALWPGGCHVFIRYDGAMTESALSRIDAFFAAL